MYLVLYPCELRAFCEDKVMHLSFDICTLKPLVRGIENTFVIVYITHPGQRIPKQDKHDFYHKKNRKV